MLRAVVKVGGQTREVESDTETEIGSDESSVHEQEYLEPWIEWLRCSASISADLAKQRGIQDWVEEQRCRQWQLAGQMARTTDERWSTKLLYWILVVDVGPVTQ